MTSRRERHVPCWSLLLLAGMTCPFAGGCVYPQLVITSDPPGAVVQIDGKTIGATPVDYPFTYYGTHHIVLLRDGFQTQIVQQPVPAPWYEVIGLDFVSENLLPFTVRDVRRFHYTMQPLQFAPPEAVLERSGELRLRGQGIGVPPAAPVPVLGAPVPGQPNPGAGPAAPPPGAVPGANAVPQGTAPNQVSATGKTGA